MSDILYVKRGHLTNESIIEIRILFNKKPIEFRTLERVFKWLNGTIKEAPIWIKNGNQRRGRLFEVWIDSKFKKG